MDNVTHKHSESLKRAIVDEVESGRMSRADASLEYGVAKSLLQMWLNEYGRFKPKRSVVEIVMKSEKDKIAELEKALAEAHLKIRVYDEILNEADRRYKLDLKKNFGIPPSVGSEVKASKSKRSAKP
jgi:transposase-like protein